MAEDGPRTERIKNIMRPWTHDIGIQLKRKELTKIFMMISNWRNFGFHGHTQIFPRCKGQLALCQVKGQVSHIDEDDEDSVWEALSIM